MSLCGVTAASSILRPHETAEEVIQRYQIEHPSCEEEGLEYFVIQLVKAGIGTHA